MSDAADVIADVTGLPPIRFASFARRTARAWVQ
jgi:hypothetical protein